MPFLSFAAKPWLDPKMLKTRAITALQIPTNFITPSFLKDG
jgi:hypothetical protein